MKAKTKAKPNPKAAITPALLRQLHLKANEEQIRLQTTRQIALAMAQVLIHQYKWTPERVTELSAKIVHQVRVNNGIEVAAVDNAPDPL